MSLILGVVEARTALLISARPRTLIDWLPNWKEEGISEETHQKMLEFLGELDQLYKESGSHLDLACLVTRSDPKEWLQRVLSSFGMLCTTPQLDERARLLTRVVCRYFNLTGYLAEYPSTEMLSACYRPYFDRGPELVARPSDLYDKFFAVKPAFPFALAPLSDSAVKKYETSARKFAKFSDERRGGFDLRVAVGEGVDGKDVFVIEDVIRSVFDRGMPKLTATTRVNHTMRIASLLRFLYFGTPLPGGRKKGVPKKEVPTIVEAEKKEAATVYARCPTTLRDFLPSRYQPGGPEGPPGVTGELLTYAEPIDVLARSKAKTDKPIDVVAVNTIFWTAYGAGQRGDDPSDVLEGLMKQHGLA